MFFIVHKKKKNSLFIWSGNIRNSATLSYHKDQIYIKIWKQIIILKFFTDQVKEEKKESF